MKTEDKAWLDSVFPKFYGKTLMKDTLRAYLEAERIFKGATKIHNRSCSCELGGLASYVNTEYERYKK